ncbi:MAG: MraY family glycosyltransferase [Elusimicrobiota bacterium]|nr:MraY family glycosyltransferase [Elusimicrobiota bacterium]
MLLYLTTFLFSFVIALILTLVFRYVAMKLSIYDYPISNVKTHKTPVPYLGGCAISIAFWLALMIVRFSTDFPTGTLRALRGIFLGSFIIFLLGLIDDVKHKGINFKMKFFVQLIAGILLILYGIRIKFIQPDWFAIVVTVVWIVGITNALNIIDIMDGLSSGIAFIAACGFFIIGIPQEEEIYVNFVAVALAGACLGFLPYNLSKKYKIFMGDVGSLFIGFVLAAIALGTKYTEVNNLGLFAPIMLLAIPIYDTLLVSYFRWKKGMSPFLGSKDHFPLRLESAGWSRGRILLLIYAVAIFLSAISFIVTVVKYQAALFIYLVTLVIGIFFAIQLGKIKVD